MKRQQRDTLPLAQSAANHLSFQPSPLGRGWSAAAVLTRRSGPGEGLLLKELGTGSVLQLVNADNSDSTRWLNGTMLYFGFRVQV